MNPRCFLRIGAFCILPAIGLTLQACGDTVKVIAAGHHYGGGNVPILVRVELRDDQGRIRRDVWNAEANLTVEPTNALFVSPNRVLLRNGVGSLLVVASGSPPDGATLYANIGGLRGSRFLPTSTNTVRRIGGTLPASETWSGIVQITNDLTIPAGMTLTIQSNTLVMLNGAASGSASTDIFVNGSIQSLGTEDHPVTFAAAGGNWGQIRHNNAQPSLYRYTSLFKGGRAVGEGHTGTAPMIRPNNSVVRFEYCNFTDLTDASGTTAIGKVMQAAGSDVTFDGCILSRARMGPEISTTGILCTNTWITDMNGPDDSDGIYLHDAPGKRLLLTDCVIAYGTDDGVDLLNTTVDFENCIIRDWSNASEDAKGISAFHGITRIKRCLFVNCHWGVGAKSGGPNCFVTLNNCTVDAVERGLSATFKDNAQAGNIDFRVTNCIVRAQDSVASDFSPTNFPSIVYTHLTENWTGAGNSTTNPMFVNPAAYDFHLQPGSSCIDSGHPDTPSDPDGSPADRGYYRFMAPAPQLSMVSADLSGAELSLIAYTNRNYVVEFSSNCVEWLDLGISWQGSNTVAVTDSTPAEGRFYRARLAP